MKYETVIGLEVHAQLKTRTKLFCRCENIFGREGNTLTCPVCLGMPGALPVLNEQAVRFAILTGLALGCKVHETSVFSRKNYFYPDLPKGYQISQYDRPLCTHGQISIDTPEGKRVIGIHRVHMEEDAGKLLHGDNLLTKEGSLVDLNRAGVPLVEIVGNPDLRSGEEAARYLRKLRTILRYLDVCDGNMEEGSFRCDANVSIRPRGSDTLGTKVEVKNMNSFKHVQKAIEHEMERQIGAVEAGERIVQETRLYNPDRGVTLSMRSKEHAHDYRYFPEPDLRPLAVPHKWISDLRNDLPELPDERRARFEKEYSLPPYDAEVLTSEKETADYFESTVHLYGGTDPAQVKTVSNFITSEVFRLTNEKGIALDRFNVRPQALAELLRMRDEGTISGKMAKEILDEMSVSGKAPAEIVKEKGMTQLSDPEELRKVIRGIIEANPGQHAEYRSGKEKLFGYFVGQTMKATQGKGNPKLINDILKEELARGV